jgi:outer membrane lipoprotein carrier protein
MNVLKGMSFAGWQLRLAAIAMALSCSVAAAASTPAMPAVESNEAGYLRVDRFMKGLTGLEATFKQVLRDSRGQVAEQSSGTLQILRPDRFRWDYEVPHAQTIVSDGTRLWLYDPDLEQVTVRRLDQTLAGTPAMLLSGGGDLRATFTVERVEQGGAGIVWVLLLPKREDTDFRRVRLGFNGDALRFMELEDKLNQTTVLEFIALRRNPAINADRFTFTPPEGADVIGESPKPE